MSKKKGFSTCAIHIKYLYMYIVSKYYYKNKRSQKAPGSLAFNAGPTRTGVFRSGPRVQANNNASFVYLDAVRVEHETRVRTAVD